MAFHIAGAMTGKKSLLQTGWKITEIIIEQQKYRFPELPRTVPMKSKKTDVALSWLKEEGGGAFDLFDNVRTLPFAAECSIR